MIKNIDFLFETSWEVCNKVGGINTVISTKAAKMAEKLGNKYILIGPDILKEGAADNGFIEDKNLFESFRVNMAIEGINLRIGRWNIDSEPVVFLIDFTSLYTRKNEIFTELWNNFKLDSITGQWDYVEPALFGYAAGLVISRFQVNMLSHTSLVVAHFHEWMTGSGVLYLKNNAPQIATAFTTHATILGRTLAGNNYPIYSKMDEVQPAMMADNFNIRAKYSLEKISATEADVFTTVSELTSEECGFLLEKKADLVTPNGFNLNFVPTEAFENIRSTSRNSVLKIAEATLGYKLDDPFLIVNSGRYEFKNKGIDMFIESLSELRSHELERDVLAIISVPADSREILHDVAARLNGENVVGEPSFLTHRLEYPNYDPVLNMLKSKGFSNSEDSKVKIIFMPFYLNGDARSFGLKYYEFLMAFDLSVFPSYYEPWGYTPMESLAFSIPTITTDLAGFGLWVKSNFKIKNSGLVVCHRDDLNFLEATTDLKESILNFYKMDMKAMKKSREEAYKVAQGVEWSKLVDFYFEAYDIAINMLDMRKIDFDALYHNVQGRKFKEMDLKKPNWNKAFVAPNLPDILLPLNTLAKNIWWTWNNDAAALFKSIDPDLWMKASYNPLILIESLDSEKIKSLSSDGEFLQNLNKVFSDFQSYMAQKPAGDSSKIAYFSMEYGLHDTVKIFSGGLGILAGDYLKEASDKNFNMVAVGLLYRYGYFKQRITQLGDQIAEFKAQKFTHMPLEPVRDSDGNWLHININLPGRVLVAKAWALSVGRIKLYLLDADLEENQPGDRQITHQLYGGGNENRFLQELLLGVGGVRMLEKAGENPLIYHSNEGHAAMISFERLAKYINNHGLGFNEALEVVRASTLFTTHTPVPAGHDVFEEDLVRKYISHYPDRLRISWEEFMALGKVNPADRDEKFSMSNLAIRISQEVNGVSRIHGRVSREMFTNLYPGYYADEIHIGYVTNGVHWPTWTAKRWQLIFNENIHPDFVNHQSDLTLWDKINELPDKLIWETRQHQKNKLFEYLNFKLQYQMKQRMVSPNEMLRVIEKLDPKILTIGFARRFATYKRAHLLFSNLERLDRIINDPKMPVQFIFAGKAHPADKAGQDLIKRIVDISRMPQFEGRIIFIENYDIEVGKKLVQGVDVWLNNPTRPLEASGTSGEKAVMNGVLNLSVLDGWWAEGYVDGAGWALEERRTYLAQDMQDDLDSTNIYKLLENEVKPAYYSQNSYGVSERWVKMVKKNFAEISPRFTMTRMIDDYQRQYYSKLITRSKLLQTNNFEKAREISKWKSNLLAAWNNVEVLKVEFPNFKEQNLLLGDSFDASVKLRLPGLTTSDVGIEILFGIKDGDEIKEIVKSQMLEPVSFNNEIATYSTKISMTRAGVFDFTFRVFPTNSLLPHRMDMPVIEWI